jgi:integrase
MRYDDSSSFVSELVDVKVEQIDLKAATIHIRRAKNGTPGIHGLQGDELRLIRALLRENAKGRYRSVAPRSS